LDQVDIGDVIVVADNHNPPPEEEIVTDLFEIDQGWGKAQLLQPAQHCFG
jgi:hypothetical protein